MARERADAPPADHLPVLFSQVMDGLRVNEAGRHLSGIYLDGTYGRGGHARGVLERLEADARLLLMDKDPDAVAHAQQTLGADPRVQVRQGSFAELARWEATADGLDGVLFDLGVSSPQLDRPERGFSFQQDGPLDMRMDPSAGESAADWLARAEEQEIAEVLWTYGEERMGRRIARAIVARRGESPLRTTGELADLLSALLGRRSSEKGRQKHPATRTFQALRIHVNRELADLEHGLLAAHERLRPGGRLAVISFHSLEDRIVKQFIHARARPPAGNRRLPDTGTFAPTLREIGGAVQAGSTELIANPRARSAVLRVAERLA